MEHVLGQFAFEIYLWLLGAFATPIVLSYVLRRIAGRHAPSRYAVDQNASASIQRDDDDEQEYLNAYWAGLLLESPYDD